MKKHSWTIVFTSCLLAFTVFLAMDTFVISNAYQTDATEMNTEMFQEAEADVKTGKADTEDEEASGEEEDSEDTKGQTAEENRKDEEAGTDQETDSSEDKEADSDSDSDSDSGSHKKRPGTSGSAEKPGSHGGPGHSKSASGKSSEESLSESTDESSGESSEESSSESSEDSSSKSSEDSSSKSSEGASGESAEESHSASSGKSAKSLPGSSSKGKDSFDEEEAAEEAAAVTTDNEGSSETYEDENVKITYTQYTTNGTTIHVADVQLSSAEYLKTAFAEDTYGKNVTDETSEIAQANNAILAINGDYYGVQEKGYVIRNGIVYRDEAGESEVLCIYADGSMEIIDPSEATAQELVDRGVWQAFSFGPGLLEDGEISVSLDSEVGRARASNPRTAIGMIDDLHYVFVVSDGRSDDSEGLSLYELASFMEQLGVQTAYNLDGGGSSTMVFRNEIVNNPSGGFGDSERKVSDIVYIG